MAKEDVTLVPVPAKKSKFKFILILLLCIPAAGAGGFFGWRYFSPAPAAAAAESEASTEEAPAEESESATSEHGEGERGGQSTVLNFEPFLVNLADKEISRYLRVTIRLQVTSKQAAEKIATADVLTSQMRDSILGILSSRSSDQITTPEGKDQLKSEIATKLNSFLPGKAVKAVFFTDFVVQL
jgi:flagellar FliL protein